MYYKANNNWYKNIHKCKLHIQVFIDKNYSMDKYLKNHFKNIKLKIYTKI